MTEPEQTQAETEGLGDNLAVTAVDSTGQRELPEGGEPTFKLEDGPSGYDGEPRG